ncbi:MAG: hypothetical protein NVS3B24_02020 [Candidatus Dormibacteria bacterium]
MTQAIRRWTTLEGGLGLVPWLGALVLPVFLLLVLTGDSKYNQYVAGYVLIYGISALGLDWLMGRAGVVSLGNGAIMAFGALTAAFLAQHSWASFPLVLLIVTILGGVLGALISLPAGRLKGIYFALVTLALQVVVVFFGRRYVATSAAFVGGIPLPVPTIGPIELSLGEPWLIFLTIVMGVVILLLTNMYRGQPGRAWMAIRESELAATTIGVEARPAKTSAFVGSSALIALSGALMAYYVGRMAPDTFTLTFAIGFVVMVIVGGLRSISGVLLGSTIVTVAPLLLGKYAQGLPSTGGGITGWFTHNVFFINSGLFGLLVLVVLLYMPAGIVPTLSERFESMRRRLERHVGAGKRLKPARTSVEISPVSQSVPGGRTAVNNLLEMVDVSMTYRNGAQALVGVDLAVATSEILGIVGRNGVGKTSLMRSITGFYRSEGARLSGRIYFDGRNIIGGSPVAAARAGIALVPEREKVFPGLTVAEHLRNVGDLDAAKAALPNEWKMLEDKWQTRAGLMSGGERQLLALAMAASLRPRLLLIDEMSLGLSPIAIDRVSAAISSLQQQAHVTVIVVEQNVEVARRLCGRVILMEAGQLLADMGEVGALAAEAPAAAVSIGPKSTSYA